MSDSTAVVRADFLAAIQPFISTEETRYYLNGVYIEPHPVKGAILVVTDGHTLAAIHDEEAIITGPARIWKMDWVGLLRSVSKERKGFRYVQAKLLAELHYAVGETPTVRLVFGEIDNGGAAGIELVSKRTKDLVIDGTFPEWRHVVPRYHEDDSGRPQFQPRYVAKLAAFGTALSAIGDRTLSMEIVPMSSNGPAIARYSGAPHAFCVIMPIRGETMEAGPPAQFFAEAEPEQIRQAA